MDKLGLIIHPEDFKDLLEMTPEETGKVTQNVIKYFIGEEVVDFDDRYLDRVSRDMKGRIDRDRKNYKDKAYAGSIGGKRGGAPKGNQNATKNKAESKQIQSKNKAEQSTDKAEQSTDKAEQSENKAKQTLIPIPIPKPINNNINSFVEEIVAFLNEKTGKRFQPRGETERLINGRLNEGYTVDDFKKVITIKCNEWKDDPKYSRYLQPSTLFAPSHFDEYLNQPEKVKSNANRFTEGVTQRDYNFDELEKKLIKN